jgi:hypothetical protein
MIKAKKINFIPSNHLSEGNWGEISKKLKFFHDSRSKINCYEWLDRAIKEESIEGKWIGFLHNTISYPENEYPNKYKNKILPISKLKDNKYFKEKIKSCQGIFVFTKNVKKYIDLNLKTNVNFLYHPILNYKKEWKCGEQVVHAGQQLRKYHSFLQIVTNKKKIILKPRHCEFDLQEMKKYSKGFAEEIGYLKPEFYIDLLCRSVVFLDLYDVAACNLINECISLNVPIVVKKMPGCIEYLGDTYPLYFEDLKEAEAKLNDEKLILESHFYLKSMNKKELSLNYFLYDFAKKSNLI